MENFSFKNLIFWEPVPSPHKLHLLRELASVLPKCNVICVADAELSEDRRSLGWSYSDPNLVNLTIVVHPSDSEICQYTSYSDVLHVFSGIRWVETISKGLEAVLVRGSPFMIMSEPRASEGYRGFLRYLHSIITERRVRRQCLGVFAIGAHGRNWFESTAYDARYIYDYAYFVDSPRTKDNDKSEKDVKVNFEQRIRVGFLGRVVTPKGVHLIPSALHQTVGKCTFLLAGTGPLIPEIAVSCEKYNVPFTNVGKIAIADVGEFLSSLDILVLPSLTTDDGWGVVVSEALMVGTSVIVSSKAGASLVLQDPLLGKRVKPNCSASIAEAIDEIVASKELTHERRELRRKVAVKLLSAESGAAFFLKAVAHATTRSDTTPHPDWPDLSSILSDVEKNQIFGVSAPVEASFE